MNNPITYSLRDQDEYSDGFYEHISIFTDEVEQKIDGVFAKTVADFQQFLEKNGIEQVRTKEEYELEVLMIGVFWNVYQKRAMRLQLIPRKCLEHLYRMRKQKKHKQFADRMRGILMTLFLQKESHITVSKEDMRKNYTYILKWLSATGDFEHELNRLYHWSTYLESLLLKEANEFFHQAIQLVDWFEKRSEVVLGQYTQWVDSFLAGQRNQYQWREDLISCGRKRVEYHLNMVGAHLLNEAYRVEFEQCKDKRLLLPGCMRSHAGKQCMAIETKNGLSCQKCSKDCLVRKYTQWGEENHFSVYVVPHESSMQSTAYEQNKSVGIVGVACVLNLIAGGWKAMEMGYVPQCVLLDYCGCQNHWDKTGITTELNENRLKLLLKIKTI